MAAPDVGKFHDEVATLIATYATGVSETLDPRTERAAKAALIDSLAVAMGALGHPAAQAARRHAYRFASGSEGCILWGTPKRAAPELAALVNGVLLRCYDYNDFFVGKRNSGHPSDMVGGLVAAAEWMNAPGTKLLSALAIGYEVVAAMFDAFSTALGGWDYTNLTAIGATCGIARLLDLTRAQTQEALAMTVVPHFASDEIESGDLNARGDLTMWKRFNGSDAVKNALQACFLASVGVEGAIRPFTGKNGFVRMLKNEDPMPVLRVCLDPQRPLSRVAETYMKRWPVGSLGQSAIQAALQARAAVRDTAGIKQVRIFAEEGAYDHLVRIRTDPWHPISRETADHSLPYIVAAAVLDGQIRTGSFDPKRVLDPPRQRFLAEKVIAQSAPELGTIAGGKHARAEAGYLSRVEIEMEDGAVLVGEARPFPGHPKNPFSDEDLNGKLRDNLEPLAGAQAAHRLAEFLGSIERRGTVRDLTAALGQAGSTAIDAAPAG
jgi:2-methylcitrate dehydratase